MGTTMIGKTQGMIHSWMIQTLDLTISCFPMIRPPLIHRRQRRTPPPGLRPSLRPKLQPIFQPNLQPNPQPNPPQDLLPWEAWSARTENFATRIKRSKTANGSAKVPFAKSAKSAPESGKERGSTSIVPEHVAQRLELVSANI